MHAPLKSHFDTALRVLKYLKLAPGLSVNFSKDHKGLGITAYFDSNWAKCLVTRKSAVQIAANPVMHEKTKHFDIDVHLVKEKVASGLIKTVNVDSKSQVLDILAKALGSYQHTFLKGLANDLETELLVTPVTPSPAVKASTTAKAVQPGATNPNYND
ncbi:ribonuclease H-like domain-containing protein [Tanacetum coccineum]